MCTASTAATNAAWPRSPVASTRPSGLCASSSSMLRSLPDRRWRNSPKTPPSSAPHTAEENTVDYYDSEIDFPGDVKVLTMTGETDLSTTPQFRRDLDEAMQVTSGHLILDLTDLELVDSTALGIMMAAAGRMMTEQRSLVLVVARSQVLRVFAITGLLSFFSIAATRAEAMTRVSTARVSRKVA